MFVDLAADEGVPFAAIAEATLARVAGSSIPAWRPRTRSTRGEPGSTPTGSSARPSGFRRRSRTSPRWRSWSTSRARASRSTRATCGSRPTCGLDRAVLRAVEPGERRGAGRGRDPPRRRHPRPGGNRRGLRALRHLLDDARSAAPGGRRPPVAGERPRALARTARRRARFDEQEALAMLADSGVRSWPRAWSRTREAAVAAAAEIGFPVALKTATPGVAHKSDVGGVRVGIADAPALVLAYARSGRRLGPRGRRWRRWRRRASRSRSASSATARSARWSLVAAGGVLVEVLRDRRLALPPRGRCGRDAPARRARDPAARWTASVARRRPTSRRSRTRSSGCPCSPSSSVTGSTR